MKRIVFALLTASVLAMSEPAFASAPVDVYFKDKPIPSDAAPIIDNGRVLIPLRPMADSLDASVSWNPQSKTATIRKWSETVKFTVGTNNVYYEKDGQANQLTLDASIKLVNNRLYIPLRFLSQFFGYQIDVSEEAVFINSPLSQYERETLKAGDLADARKIAMNLGPATAHYALKPLAYKREREGFQSTFLFPIGESNRFFLLSDDTVSFYELQDDFFVVTWQAYVPIGDKGIIELFLENKISDMTGKRPDIKGFFFYQLSEYMTSTKYAAGRIDPDGTITETGIKRIVGDEIMEQSGSLALKLPDERRLEQS